MASRPMGLRAGRQGTNVTSASSLWGKLTRKCMIFSPTVTRLGASGSSWAHLSSWTVLRLIALTLVIRIRVARARVLVSANTLLPFIASCLNWRVIEGS